MRRIVFFILVTALTFFASCTRASENSQLVVMIGSESEGFEEVQTMKRLSEGGAVWVSGEDYGGSVSLFLNGTKRKTMTTGGHVIVASTEITSLVLQGNTETDLYVAVLFHVFYGGPGNLDGVVLHAARISAGDIDYALDISPLIEEARTILMP